MLLASKFFPHRRPGGLSSRLCKARISAHFNELITDSAYKESVCRGELGAIFKVLCKRTDAELAKANFDISASGSTLVLCAIVGDTLTVGNLGDSRAIMGHMSGADELVELDSLTQDHKPDLPAEKRFESYPHARFQLTFRRKRATGSVQPKLGSGPTPRTVSSIRNSC